MEDERRIMGFHPADLLPPQQAVRTYLQHAAIAPPARQRVELAHAFGRILAADVRADRDHPAVARSAMDGFAVRASDAPGTLRIAGEVAMGTVFAGTLGAGEAVAIPTGGAVPAGADAVVPVEDVLVDGGTIALSHAVTAGDCITPAADDMRSGEVLLRAGRRLGPAEVAVLAAVGCARPEVFGQPSVAVLSSGDELVGVEATPGPAQIRDSNRYAVAASLASAGARPVMLPVVPDNVDALEMALRAAHAEHDAVFLTGGSSVGAKDHTPRAVAALGSPGVIVHGLRIKPGKPTLLASAGGKPVIGLPGNPASALIVLEAVCGPIVRALTGALTARPAVSAVLEEDVRGRPGWTWFVPVRLRCAGGELRAAPLQIRSSSVSLTARSGGFLTLDEAVSELQAGTVVAVHLFSEDVS